MQMSMIGSGSGSSAGENESNPSSKVRDPVLGSLDDFLTPTVGLVAGRSGHQRDTRVFLAPTLVDEVKQRGDGCVVVRIIDDGERV